MIDLQCRLPIAIVAGGINAAHHHLEDRPVAAGGDLLRETGHLRARPHPHLAAVGRDSTGNQLQQRRLALTVAAEQADALTSADLQGGIVEQGLPAEAQGDFIEAHGGHEAAYGMRLRRLTHVRIPVRRNCDHREAFESVR